MNPDDIIGAVIFFTILYIFIGAGYAGKTESIEVAVAWPVFVIIRIYKKIMAEIRS